MTASELMKAMAAAGAPFEAILIAVEALDAKDAEIAARDAEKAEKRAKDAERKRVRRASTDIPRTRRGKSSGRPPIDNIHTPPDISPDGESQTAHDECEPVLDEWNRMAPSYGLPVYASLSPKRRKACKARIRDDGLDAIQMAIRHIPKSSFLRGDTGNWSGANIDFLLRPDTVTRILEGQFDDRRKTVQPGNGHGLDRRSSLARAIDEGLDWLGGSQAQVS